MQGSVRASAPAGSRAAVRSIAPVAPARACAPASRAGRRCAIVLAAAPQKAAAAPAKTAAGKKAVVKSVSPAAKPAGAPAQGPPAAALAVGAAAALAAVAAALAKKKSGKPLKVMISGAPAAGKGTQCAMIIKKYGMVHISVGDLLRDEVKNGTAAGKRAKDFMDRGVLVPDEVVVDMVKLRMAQPDVQARGWLLDGYPRSASQAEAIEREGIRPDVFILMNVPDAVLIERVVGRRLDPVTGDIYHLKFKPPPAEIVPRLQVRSDDTEEKARTRLATHASNVAAVLGYYKAQLVELDGNRSMDAVFKDVEAILSRK